MTSIKRTESYYVIGADTNHCVMVCVRAYMCDRERERERERERAVASELDEDVIRRRS